MMQVTNYTQAAKAAETLVEKIRKRKGAFQPVYIISGHKETNDWLTSVIAEKVGIAAHVYFVKPEAFVELVYKILIGKTKEGNILKKEAISWLIYDALDKTEEEKVRSYISGDSHKRLALAIEINSLFEKYQLESPHIIRAWNKEERSFSDKNKDEGWQQSIWQKIRKAAGNQFPDITRVYDELKDILKSEPDTEVIRQAIAQVHCFGSLHYTPDFLEMISLLSPLTEVYLYRQELFAGEKYHPVADRLCIISKRERELFEKMKMTGKTPGQESPKKTSLLQQVQTLLTGHQVQKVAAEPQDHSLSIHSHYTINREVEGLYHFLIKQFEKNKELSQREVCVICPDIQKYAPAIRTWFDREDCKISYTFYDSSNNFHASPYHALEALLKIDSSYLTSIQILSLLNFSYIRDAFGLQSEPALFKRILVAANIRHGYEGDQEKETHYVSWLYGFRRLLYGTCMQPGIEADIQMGKNAGMPVDQFEQQEMSQLMGLYRFVSLLSQWLKERNEARTLDQWATFIADNTIDVFLDVKEYDPLQFNRVLEQFSSTGRLMTEKVEYTAFRHSLLLALSRMEPAEKSGFGGVRFIQPSPYLSAPARIYAFLGMNGDVFPGSTHRLSFDLSDKNVPQKAEYDKHLFVNLLLSAKETFYISYIGSNSKNNSSIPPSMLLEELWMLIREATGESNKKNLSDFIVKHPLHSFSKKYVSGDERLIRYVAKRTENKLSGNNHTASTESPFQKDADGRQIIPLHELTKFLLDPIKYYYNRVLNIWYSDWESEPDECELFGLENLEEWPIKNQQLISALAGGNDGELMVQRLKQRGGLPLSNLGQVTFNRIQDEFNEKFLNSLKPFTGETPITVYVDVVVDRQFRITGNIPGVYCNTNQYLFASVSDNKAKYRLPALLHHKVLTRMEEYSNITLHYLTANLTKEIVSANNALSLSEVCTLMANGMQELQAFALTFLDDEKSLPANFHEVDEYVLNKCEGNYDYSDYAKNAIRKGLFTNAASEKSFTRWLEVLKGSVNI